QHPERDLRADRLHPEQHQEQLALLLAEEAIQLQRVIANDEMGVERNLLANGRNVPERLRRDREAVADAADVDDDMIGAADDHGARHERDHSRATASASGARLASQIATASASAAW